MKSTDINLVAILMDRPRGTKLYSSVLGICTFTGLNDDEIYPIGIVSSNGKITASMMADGKYDVFGECLLFPSKAMRDWNRFSWKIGDVLSYGAANFCIFGSWANDDYTEFHAKFMSDRYSDETCKTLDWTKEYNEKVIKQYISNIEKAKGGKLNLETLEIEKQTQFKDGDIMYFELKDGYKFISIFQKFSSQKKPMVYASYFLNDTSLHLADKSDGYNILCDWHEIKEMRLATYSEKELLFSNLAKIGKKWNPDTKQIEDLLKEHEFKTLDYMLVRDKDRVLPMWQLYQYAHENEKYIYAVGSFFGLDREIIEVLPYNENTAHLLGTTDDWEGGEE